MFSRLADWFSHKERQWRRSFGTDIVDPVQRRRSRWHYNWLDHAILRGFWHNFHEIAPGVYRSNQPTHRRLKRYRNLGIRTVLNLRGEDRFAHYLFLEESCKELGMRLVSVKMTATRAPTRKGLIRLLDAFDEVEPPFVMHCKSGADRTGLAAALYLMTRRSQSVQEARRQLHWRHVHFRNSDAGVLDEVLDAYEARLEQGPIDVETWIRTEYRKENVSRAFALRRAGR